MVITRFCMALTISRLWVTTTTVVPLSLISSNSFMISQELLGSRLPVGSSAKSMDGLFTSARASATRCCSPPESCLVLALYLPASPTVARIAGTFLRISLTESPRYAVQMLHFHKHYGHSAVGNPGTPRPGYAGIGESVCALISPDHFP